MPMIVLEAKEPALWLYLVYEHQGLFSCLYHISFSMGYRTKCHDHHQETTNKKRFSKHLYVAVVRAFLHDNEDHLQGYTKMFQKDLNQATELKDNSDHCKLILL